MSSLNGSPPLLHTLLLILLSGFVYTPIRTLGEGDQGYVDGGDVILWANKVGPYHNPSESYPFYSIPGCPPIRPPAGGRPVMEQPDSFGVILQGDTTTDTGMTLPFKREQQFQKICELKLTQQETIDQLTYIVQNHYWYHLIIDELPVFGMIGEYITEEEMKAELDALQSKGDEATTTVPKAQGFIYTHKDISIAYNGPHIIEVNLTSENPRPLILGETYPITYSVTWQSTSQPFATRFDRYLDFDFFDHQIHWFSIVNSFMLVVFLCGLVLLILSRTIKTSLNTSYADTEVGVGYRGAPSPPGVSSDKDLLLSGGVEETGWKLLLGDVFRAPSHLLLYSVLLGTGVQLFLLIFGALLLAFSVTYYDEQRGLLISLFLVFYSLASGVQGYVSGWHYKLHGGLKWKQAMWCSALAYPSFVLSVLICLNMVAVSFGSHGVLNLSTVFVVTLIWSCVSVPLTIGGTIIGRSQTQVGAFPCRVNAIKRMIPAENGNNATLNGVANGTPTQWYSNYWLLVAMSGILPFGSVFIEMYFVFTSFWNNKIYYVYGFTFLIFIIFLIVNLCVAIVSTYILLNSEDYRWHIFSFLCSCASSGYIFLYSIYFFYAKTHMEGVLQTTYYFAYVILALVTLSLVTGSIGALGTRLFITKIYSYTKAD